MSRYRAMGHDKTHEHIVQAMAQALTDMLAKADAKSVEEWFAQPDQWLNLSLSRNGEIVALSAVDAHE